MSQNENESTLLNQKTKATLARMTREQMEARLKELNAKLGVTVPFSTAGGRTPPAQDPKDMEERMYLMNKLTELNERE
jgi:hypothetical protein